MTFDTDELNHILTLDKRTSLQRDILNTFNRHAYYRYKQIRDCCNTRKCKHMTIDKVRNELTNENKILLITKLLGITREEIFYMVDYADEYLEYVR